MRGSAGFTIGTIVVVLAILVGLFLGFPLYNVYSKQMAGRASYEEAVQNRRIRVLEAQAALDAAKLTAQAEVERARGADQANRIMAEGLGGPEAYLRWSYINMLQETAGQQGRQTIYVPTEAGMPILEAGRIAGQRPD